MTVLQRLLRRTASPVLVGEKGPLPDAPMSAGSTVACGGSAPSSCGAIDPMSGAVCTEQGWHGDHQDHSDPAVIVRWSR